jgi:death-on-curing protein
MHFRPSVDDVIELHRLVAYDPPRLLDRAGLDAALAQPWQSAFGEDAYPTVHLKAAALLRGIDRRQAFQDGNKRTAFAAVRLFYELSGFEFLPPDGDMYDVQMYVAAAEDVDLGLVAERFEQWAVPMAEPLEY